MKKILTIIMTAALFVAMAIPTFAASVPGLPDFDNLEYSYNNYLITQADSGQYYILFLQDDGSSAFKDITYVYVDYGSFIKVTNDSTYDILHSYYVLNNVNEDWQLSSHGSLRANYTTLPASSVSKIIASTVDIVDTDGNVVFTGASSINQVLTGQVPALVVKPMMETLNILVPFGVGLMALLICFPILRKVFYQFQII